MRTGLLSLALYAAVHAVPILRSDARSQPDDKANILPGKSGYDLKAIHVGNVGQEAGILLGKDAREYNQPENVMAAIADIVSGLPNDVIIPDSLVSPDSEDPQLGEILDHVEEVLDSNAPAEEQLDWIVDAIVHHTESLRKEHDDRLWSEAELVSVIDDGLTNETPGHDEGLETIYDDILLHIQHEEESANGSSHELVLSQIEGVVYGPESSQKKIKKILNEIADYVDSEANSIAIGYNSSQIVLGGNEESLEDISAVQERS